MLDIKNQMIERRKSPRQNCYMRGVVCPAGSISYIQSFVCDISNTGARLLLNSFPLITGNLELYLPVREQTFWGNVRWHRGNEIGIAFEPKATRRHNSSQTNDPHYLRNQQ